jgi:DNA repair protein RadC
VTDRKITIKDLPPEERPRERMRALGAGSLSNAELLAIILRTGYRQESVIRLAERVLFQSEGLRHLPNLTLEELQAIKGIGPAKAVMIKAALELGRRLVLSIRQEGISLTTPGEVANFLMEEMRFYNKEYFKIVLLNTKNQLISLEDISVGSLNASIVHPREIFHYPIKKSAAAIILVHNHPSGDPTPSREDLEVTKRLVEAGEILGIKVLDHIIVGEGRHLSFKEKGLIS